MRSRTRPAKGKAKGTRQPSRVEQRRSRDSRRTRLTLVGATVLSAVILAAWFPASALYHQRSDLNASNSQLHELRQEDTALRQESKNLDNPTEVGRIAREQYQLVSPGQQAYEILPRPKSSSPTAPYASDPGQSPPVAPSAASELPPGSVTSTTVAGSSTHGGTSPSATSSVGGLWDRMLHSLEFWR